MFHVLVLSPSSPLTAPSALEYEQQPPHRRGDGGRHGRAGGHQALLVPDHRHSYPAGPPRAQHLSGSGDAIGARRRSSANRGATANSGGSGVRPQPGSFGAVGWHRRSDQLRQRGIRGHIGSSSLPCTTVQQEVLGRRRLRCGGRELCATAEYATMLKHFVQNLELLRTAPNPRRCPLLLCCSCAESHVCSP